MDDIIVKLIGLLDQLVVERGVPKESSIIDKNIIRTDNSTLDNGEKQKSSLTSNEKRRLTESFNLFNKLFFEYKKKTEPDTKEKTKVSQIAKRQVIPPPLPQKKETKFGLGSILGGLLLFISGIAAFIMGLMNDGPFKGILKLLSRFGLKGGIAILKRAIKPFLEVAAKILKTPLKFLSKIGKFLGEGFGKVGKFLFGDIAKVAGKMFGKIGGGSLGKMLTKFIKPLAKVFKRIPIIGTIISIAFAYSRFKSGDVVGGVIDVLSGLAGLVDIVLPGVGSAMSIGLDVLNAVLDAKSDQGEGKPKKDKLTILKDMAGSVGKWIWDRRMYIPILSSVNRFMMAWDSFKAGNISEGFGNFGLALSNLVTGVDGSKIMDGISGFMGLFESDTSKEGSTPKPNKSFISEMSDVVGKKLMELWEWIKQKVKDGIAGLIPGGKAVVDFAKDTAKATGELTGYIGDKSKEAYDKTKSVMGDLWSGIVDKTKSVYTKAEAAYNKNHTYMEGIAMDMMGKAKSKKDDLVKTKDAIVDAASNSIGDMQDALVKGSNKVAEKLYKLNVENNIYLRIIANNTSMLLKSSGAKGSPTIVMPPQQSPQSQSKQMVNIPNNRDGYLSSAYSLG